MIFQVFFVGAIVSFIGSIPPGTLNILVLQLGLQSKLKAALRFALAVAIIEYPYAWAAVTFEGWITSSTVVQENFKLLAAIVMTVLGIIGLWTARKPPAAASGGLMQSGFRRGLILSILNPQAIPWWIGMVAYLKAQGWIMLNTGLRLHSFVLGTAIGTFALLTLLAFMSLKLSGLFQHNILVRILPGAILFVLGLLAFFSYFF